jgi:hypothetical protein
MSNITISETPETVNVAEFRNRIQHLEQLVHRDRHSCANSAEVERWVRSVQRIGGELIATTCKRATADDWTRRERVIDASTKFLAAAAPQKDANEQA